MEPYEYQQFRQRLESPPTRRLPLPQAPRVMAELYKTDELFPTPTYLRPSTTDPGIFTEMILPLPPRAQFLCLMVAYEMALECAPAECWEDAASNEFLQQFVLPALNLFQAWLDGEIDELEYERNLRLPAEASDTIAHELRRPCGIFYILFRMALTQKTPDGIGQSIGTALNSCAPSHPVWRLNPRLQPVVEEWAARCRARLALARWEQAEWWEGPEEIIIYGLGDPEGTYHWPFVYADGEAEDIIQQAMQENPNIPWQAPDLIHTNVSMHEVRDGEHPATLYGHPVKIFLWTNRHRMGLIGVPGTSTIEYARRQMEERPFTV